MIIQRSYFLPHANVFPDQRVIGSSPVQTLRVQRKPRCARSSISFRLGKTRKRPRWEWSRRESSDMDEAPWGERTGASESIEAWTYTHSMESSQAPKKIT